MKQVSLLSLFILSYSALSAQTGSSYLLMNFNISNSNYFARYHHQSPSGNSNTTFPIGLQWIKYNTPNTALRFGFTIFKKNLFSNYNSSYTGDTFYSTYNSFEALMPKFSIGKEWQKHIHKDVSIYGGADIGLGFMKSPVMFNEDWYIPNSSYGFSGRQTSSAFILNASVRPFTGIRVNWNRLVVGYEASMPVNYTQVFSEGVHKMDGLKLQHMLNLGYRINTKKR